MNTEQLISHTVPVLHPDDTGSRALSLMEESELDQLPVVSEDSYIGLVRENDLLDLHNTNTVLTDTGLLNFKPAVIAYNHPFEALKMANQLDLSVLPVIDRDHKYIGAITSATLLKYVTETSGINTPGGIVVLELLPRDYTLYEIARVCENEDVIIMNTQVHANEQGLLEVTLKLNRSSVHAVVASLERHNYRVKEFFGDDKDHDDIADKYDQLMHYINM